MHVHASHFRALSHNSLIHANILIFCSEFELAKANDNWRLHHLLSSQTKENSPYRTFGCGKFLMKLSLTRTHFLAIRRQYSGHCVVLGNRISLKEMPEAAGSNVYEMLRKFQEQYYNAELMTLAVESKGR